MDFQQSQTYINLQKAYEWELKVSTVYNIYSDKAQVDGYIEIGNIFTTTAKNEKEHARIFLRKLNNGIIPDTQQNLLESANFENNTATLYRDYANTAREEGFNDLAALFNGIANIELNHNLRFSTQYNDIVRAEVFCKPQDSLWICLQCGNIMGGPCAPEICPVCGFPQGYYKLYIGTED
ncbi:MAG: rubrerythrin family protein [Herbinix sp.]|nr:rubrerythrin family protein [Herbinix sp.]